MRKTMTLALILACAGFLPAAASAQSLSADLAGFTGGNETASGLAVLDISGTQITTTILTNGLGTPTGASIQDASDSSTVIDLGVAFMNGLGSGSTSSDASTLGAVLADPSGYLLVVSSDAFPSGAIRGTLVSATATGGATDMIFPVAASLPGASGTVWNTDLKLVNRGAGAATVTLSYYPESASSASGPAATSQRVLPAGSELVIDDVVATDFSVTNGKGAIQVSSDQPLTGSSRVFNDQRVNGLGTLGQQVPAMTMGQALATGLVPMLDNNASDPEGFRSNIGWFNPSATDTTLTVTFRAADGSLLATATENAPAMALVQKGVSSIASGLDAAGNFYATFSTSPSTDVFVYGSIVDNTSGDAVYVPAVQ